MSNVTSYSQAAANLPDEAILGQLLWFSISGADLDLDEARRKLAALNLSDTNLPQVLRPVDAFHNAAKEFAHKFGKRQGVRSEFLARRVGQDSDTAHRHIVLERAETQAGKKRRLVYDTVANLTLNKGTKRNGTYSGFSVSKRRVGQHVDLTPEEEAFLDSHLQEFEQRFEHLRTHIHSTAVRTFVRRYIYDLSGTLVKESGGLYFVRQQHMGTISRLGEFVQDIGSDFHHLPLLDLVDQRQMLARAFEEDTIREVHQLSGEVGKMLADPNRQVTADTFDRYALRAAELTAKISEYASMLDTRIEDAIVEVDLFKQQTLSLAGRIRETKADKAA